MHVARSPLLTLSLVSLLLLPSAGSAATVDWRYAMGLHDFIVPDVDSDTFGIEAAVAVDKRTDSGAHYFGSFDLFVDRDQDHLDSDHIPVWWMLHLGTDGRWLPLGTKGYVGWTADVNTRMNTVSSIERQIKALPAIVLGYDGDAVQASLKAGYGYFFQEIDDDAPKERGFTREGMRHTTGAESYAATASARLGGGWRISGSAQEWRDGSEWLETEYDAALHLDVSPWFKAKGSELVLSAEIHEYNLDPYPHSAAGDPVLGWNDDLMIRLSYSVPWAR
jgi:hypothetical protein